MGPKRTADENALILLGRMARPSGPRIMVWDT
jgi:hypothetical protein